LEHVKKQIYKKTKILSACFLGEPNWMEDYRRWNTDSAYFADDEDTNDYQPSVVPKTKEHERFTKDKEEFKKKYKEQIDQV
jgi:hypothetical protein